jgi:hypothetical protein
MTKCQSNEYSQSIMSTCQGQFSFLLLSSLRTFQCRSLQNLSFLVLIFKPSISEYANHAELTDGDAQEKSVCSYELEFVWN